MATEVTGEIVDTSTGRLTAARLYIQDNAGNWFFPESTDAKGSAIPYKKQRPNSPSVEMHTTVSAHPFRVQLPPGNYVFTVERGKEYFTSTNRVTIKGDRQKIRLLVQRWIDMSKQGWYSGDTHLHRSGEEMANVLLAEDINVGFPLHYWVTKAFEPPVGGDKSVGEKYGPNAVYVDRTHVFYPRNTEYEIFSVGGKPHTLGAVFVLNHKSVLSQGVPPVTPIAELARREGALLELDKHNWEWSMAIVPVMGVDLFELSNNHIWRTEFAFGGWGVRGGDYMGMPPKGQALTERQWIDYGFRNYYALLNCGFRMRPTGGTANGVHPVPAGFGRVYVQVRGEFSYEAWLRGLDAGRSFVTTGPMLFVEVNRKSPGHIFSAEGLEPIQAAVTGKVASEFPVSKVELVLNGDVVPVPLPATRKLANGSYETEFRASLRVDNSSWLAVRCFEPRGRRERFAHTGPFHFNVFGKPLRPKRAEVEFLIKRVQDEIDRSRTVVPSEALKEYEFALEVYRRIAATAR
ncbi:MAG: CehA/McbA family metallohydrolase [Verrucomicrobiota bacterium]